MIDLIHAKAAVIHAELEIQNLVSAKWHELREKYPELNFNISISGTIFRQDKPATICIYMTIK